jgi:Vault protein inter-alpha-trypsin domain/von Willebrand factor type A domain
MSLTAHQTRIDPLHAFIAGGFVVGTPRPVPLVATRFDVLIDGGLAVVTTSRTFRNAESQSIEATITFPVPVRATLFALKARIGDRVLDARAKRKDAAREDYEGALERGKTAVLHEEVLRGVHMLSVGHVAPGVEIEVRSSFAVTLTDLNGRGTLRIPLTVGDIFGRSGLPDSDDLAHGGTLPPADLAVECRGASVALIGGALKGGRAKIALDAPIDLEVSGWAPRDLIGRAADGRTVTLRIEPTAAREASLDVAILVDHSGSMQEACADDRPGLTKHQAVIGALGQVTRTAEKSDMVDLWEFDDAVTFVGSTRAEEKRQTDLATLVRALSGPRGGTEIGGSLDRVLTQSRARDVLLITDGKSHAIDVQALAQRGRRISAVLVGEDSLEANVGHLAALTGGEIFVAAGADLVAALEGAVRSLKIPHQAPAPIDGAPQHIAVRGGGMTISAQWQAADVATGDALTLRAVAAMAASLALPAMAIERAAQLAEAEGLVTHLTSLILVDEAATQETSLPATRKVALPTPRTAARPVMAAAAMMPEPFASPARPDARPAALQAGSLAKEPARSSGLLNRLRSFIEGRSNDEAPAASKRQRDRFDGGGLADTIGWDQAPHRLQAGDLTDLDPTVARAIRDLAARTEVIAVAKKLALDPVVLVIGLLARIVADRNRSAARIARAIFGKRPRREVDEAAATARIE